MELWNSHELCKAVNGKSLNKSFWQANSISIDTRSIKDGGVFFALKGNKVENPSTEDFLIKSLLVLFILIIVF